MNTYKLTLSFTDDTRTKLQLVEVRGVLIGPAQPAVNRTSSRQRLIVTGPVIVGPIIAKP
jgi:hypothetical protein